MNSQDLQALHQHSSQHEQQIKSSQKCGCFYCLKIFASEDIEDWTDNNTTAICPYCGIDSVIAESLEQRITPELLKTMKDYYF